MLSAIKSFNIELRVRCFLHFTEKFFEGLVVPFFVIYASYRLSPSYVGFSLFVVAVMAAFSAISSGYLSDTLGRKTLLLPIEVTKTFALLVLSLVITLDGSILFSFFLYFVVIVLNSMAVPVAEALTLDSTTPSQMKSIYTTLYWLTNLGRSTGTIIGIILFERFGFECITAVCAAFTGVSAWFILRKLKETHARHHNKRRTPLLYDIFHKYKSVLSDRIMMLYMTASTLGYSIAVQLAYFIAARLAREFPDQKLFSLGSVPILITGVMMFGVLRLETNLIAVFMTGPIQRITKNIDLKFLFLIGPPIASAAFAVMMVSNRAWVLIASMAVYTLSEITYVPIKHSLLAKIATAEARGTYAAVRAFDFRLALIIGALFILLSAYVSATTLALVILFMGGSVTGILLYLWKQLKNKSTLTQQELRRQS